MDKFYILLTLALILLFAQDTWQTSAKFRRAVSQSNRRYQCGSKKRQVEGLITSGTNTKLGEWPWHGGLFHRKNRHSREYKCGATLIHQNFVITASHCVVDRESGYEVTAGSITVDFGYVQLFSPSSHGQSHTVQEIFVHPEFAKDSNKHDVAVLSLKTAVRFSDFIHPICLGLSRSETSIRDIIGKQGVVVGWGLTENDETSSDLKLANLPVVDYAECQHSDPDLFAQLIFPGMFCAGSRNGTSVCNGDSGGGMYLKDGNRWFLRGITSFSGTREDGSNKCDVKSYAGFVNVQYYGPWIRGIVQEDDELANEPTNEPSTTRRPRPVFPVPEPQPPRGTTSVTDRTSHLRDYESSEPTRRPRPVFPMPEPEPPRGTTSLTNNSGYHRVSSSCPSGQHCLETQECSRFQQNYRSPYMGRPNTQQHCEIIEHNSLRRIKYCCQISEPYQNGAETYESSRDNLMPCGKRQSSSHAAIYPTPAFSNEYPWMVKLKSRLNVFECQGTLVAPSFVLLSAFCKPSNGIVSARLGRMVRGINSQCSVNRGCYEIAVKSVIDHPRFDAAAKDLDSSYNIALAELEVPAEMNRDVNTICLPSFSSESQIPFLVITSWKFSHQEVRVSAGGRAGLYSTAIAIADTEPLQHMMLPKDDTDVPEELILQGAPLQWIDNSGNVVLVAVTIITETDGKSQSGPCIIQPVVEWILSVVGDS